MTCRLILNHLSLAMGSLIALAPSTWAVTPIRQLRDIATPTREYVHRVSTAQIVLADYSLIRTDFPELAAEDTASIDRWLLARMAYVTVPQGRQAEVNGPISLDWGNEAIPAFRPFKYGRALVFTAGSGLIDVKGTGSRNPRQASHGNGLMTLGEAIREFTYQKMVQPTVLSDSAASPGVANPRGAY